MALDAALGAWDGEERYWETTTETKWTSGCCRLKSNEQTGCGCAARDPPRAGSIPAPCASAELVRGAL